MDNLAGYLDICAKANNKSNQTAEQLMEAYLGVGGVMTNLNVPLTESATASAYSRTEVSREAKPETH